MSEYKLIGLKGIVGSTKLVVTEIIVDKSRDLILEFSESIHDRL